MESSSISINDNLSIEDIDKILNRLSSKIMTAAFAKKNLTNQKIITLIISLSAGISLLSGLFLLSISPIIIGILGTLSTGTIAYHYLESTKEYKSIITDNKSVIIDNNPIDVEKAKEALEELYDSKQKRKVCNKKPINDKKPNQLPYDVACSDISCVDDLIDLDKGTSHRMKPGINTSAYLD